MFWNHIGYFEWMSKPFSTKCGKSTRTKHIQELLVNFSTYYHPSLQIPLKILSFVHYCNKSLFLIYVGLGLRNSSSVLGALCLYYLQFLSRTSPNKIWTILALSGCLVYSTVLWFLRGGVKINLFSYKPSYLILRKS